MVSAPYSTSALDPASLPVMRDGIMPLVYPVNKKIKYAKPKIINTMPANKLNPDFVRTRQPPEKAMVMVMVVMAMVMVTGRW